MNDDWSLKDKEKLWEDMCTNVYPEGVITHLRLKLIDDVYGFINKYLDEEIKPNSRYDIGDLHADILNIINKRFGVDE